MITKAVIPVAGIGSRFLPATKAIPKEMFPLVDRPVIHYIIEEVVASGIKDIIFVTSRGKNAIPDYFDKDCELEEHLFKKGKDKILERMHHIHTMAHFYFVRQNEPKGDGDAILCALPIIGNTEAFAVLWGDDIIVGNSAMGEMIAVFQKYRAPMFAVEPIEGKAIERYGVIKGDKVEDNLYKVSYVVEKPKHEDAPSNLGIVGRYIFTPEIVKALMAQKPAEDGEIRTSHAFRDAMKQTTVYAYQFFGKRFDCGNKLGWLEANVYLGVRDEEIGDDFKKFVNSCGL